MYRPIIGTLGYILSPDKKKPYLSTATHARMITTVANLTVSAAKCTATKI